MFMRPDHCTYYVKYIFSEYYSTMSGCKMNVINFDEYDLI